MIQEENLSIKMKQNYYHLQFGDVKGKIKRPHGT